MSKKNSNGTIENRTRDLAVCSAVPQPTTPPLSTFKNKVHINGFLTFVDSVTSKDNEFFF
jgi:hypothetical protein